MAHQLNLRTLLCKRALHHRRQFHSWPPLSSYYVSVNGTDFSVREGPRSGTSFVVRVRAVRWTEFPYHRDPMSQGEPKWIYRLSGISREHLARYALRLLFSTRWTSLRRKYERCTVRMYVWPAGREGRTVSADFLDISRRFIGNRWQLIIWSLREFSCVSFFLFLFFWERERTNEILQDIIKWIVSERAPRYQIWEYLSLKREGRDSISRAVRIIYSSLMCQS